jgi:hypothetical protein
VGSMAWIGVVNVLSVGISRADIVVSAVIVPLFTVVVIIVVANRATPDGRGMRPFSVWLFAMSFIALFVTIVGSMVEVVTLVQLIGSHPTPIADTVARDCVIGGILTALGGVTFGYHLGRGREIAMADGQVDGPSARVMYSYIAAVEFVFVAVLVVAAGFAIYSVFELLGPGVFGASASRIVILRKLINSGYLMSIAGVVVLGHLRWSPPELRAGLR